MIKPTVTVIGLRYGQPAQIEARCRDFADLRFVNADQSKVVIPCTDHVFLMTRFIKHRLFERVLKQVPRQCVHLHSGGLSRLVQRIETLRSGV